MTIWNQELFDKIEGMYNGTEGTEIEQFCVKHDKVFALWYRDRYSEHAGYPVYKGRRDFHSLKKLFREINSRNDVGLSSWVQKIEFFPTGEVLFNYDPTDYEGV